MNQKYIFSREETEGKYRLYTVSDTECPEAQLQRSWASEHSVCPKTTTFAVVALLFLLEQ